METDVGVEIPKTGFPHRLAKRLLAFRTVPTGPAAITNPQGWAKSDDQSGPNQVDKTTRASARNPSTERTRFVPDSCSHTSRNLAKGWLSAKTKFKSITARFDPNCIGE
jgi:hypothetical protein